jgi:hypothetical protein
VTVRGGSVLKVHSRKEIQMNDTTRRVAATSRADAVIANPGPQIHAGGVNRTVVKPGTPEHHHDQKSK